MLALARRGIRVVHLAVNRMGHQCSHEIMHGINYGLAFLSFLFFSFPFLSHGGLGWIVLFNIFPLCFLRLLRCSFAFSFLFLWGYYKIRPRVRFKDDPPLNCLSTLLSLCYCFHIHSIVFYFSQYDSRASFFFSS